MTPVNISIIYKVLWFTAAFSINMYTLLYAWFFIFSGHGRVGGPTGPTSGGISACPDGHVYTEWSKWCEGQPRVSVYLACENGV